MHKWLKSIRNDITKDKYERIMEEFVLLGQYPGSYGLEFQVDDRKRVLGARLDKLLGQHPEYEARADLEVPELMKLIEEMKKLNQEHAPSNT